VGGYWLVGPGRVEKKCERGRRKRRKDVRALRGVKEKEERRLKSIMTPTSIADSPTIHKHTVPVDHCLAISLCCYRTCTHTVKKSSSFKGLEISKRTAFRDTNSACMEPLCLSYLLELSK
jgi:hypothetical protein